MPWIEIERLIKIGARIKKRVILEHIHPFRKTADRLGAAIGGRNRTAPYSRTISPDIGSHAIAWQMLRWLNISRAILAGLFVTLFFAQSLPGEIGVAAPALFVWAGLVYFSFSVVVSLAVGKRRPGLISQTALQIGGDIGAITLFVYASGGVASGLGELLLIPMIVGALIFSLRFAMGFAAVGTIAILAQETFAGLTAAPTAGDYVQAGLLGILFFAVALLGHALADRLRESELLTAQRGIDLANLETLNDYIIQHLRAGVLVIDGDDNLRLTNRTAVSALGLVTTAGGGATPLEVAAPRLKALLDEWRRDPLANHNATLTTPDQTVLIPHFSQLGPTLETGTIAFLEDASNAAEQVRQIKLAGLGRLTASIAHEIRNPLGAIGHANQLMAESTRLSEQERRLVEIIHDHAGRVNGIVENVLKLSRGGRLKIENIALEEWLWRFAGEFKRQHALSDEDLRVTVHPGRAPLKARADASQLRQIVANLGENALRYGIPANMTPYGERSLLEFRLSIRPFRNQPCLEILDHGEGVPTGKAEEIFEPFHTSSSQGTGLGLFIARELCECNHATLTYHRRGNGGSCFRITFANADSWID